MRLVDVVRQLWSDLSAQRLRTVLTVLGITWGTVAVVVLLAFSVGLERQTIKRFHGLGDRIVVLFGGRTVLAHAGFREGRTIRLRETDARILARQIPDITMISPEYSTREAPVRRGPNGVSPNITGIHPVYGEMRNIFPLPGGRFINERDQEERRRVVFLGNEVAGVLFGDRDPVGEQVRIGDSPFTVIGVLQPKIQNSSYNSRDEDRVFIPASTHAAIFGSRFVSNLVYRTADASRTAAVEARVYEVLGRKYRFDPQDEDALEVWDTAEWERMFGFLFLGFKLFFAIVGCFTLSVGGIGVANIMYVVVRERTQEIGIKLAVGARRRHIVNQFMFEAILIAVGGGLLGLAVASLLVIGIDSVPSKNPALEYIMNPKLSLPIASTCVGLLMVIGLVAGILPARKAARLDPVESLRYE